MKNLKFICGIVFFAIHFLSFGQTYNVDSNFNMSNTGVQGSAIYSSIIQPDGKIIICGYFDSYNGVPRKDLARLNPDGTLDLSFNSGVSESGTSFPKISNVAIDSNGKIIVVGRFTSFGGFSRNNVARLNSDGSIDTSFNGNNLIIVPEIGEPYVNVVKVTSNGKILIGGSFKINAPTSNVLYGLACLNSNGSFDSTFVYNTNDLDELSIVQDIQFQSDNKIIISINNNFKKAILRFNLDGSLDSSFFNSGYAGAGFTVKILPDDKILLGGLLVLTGETNDIYRILIKLNADGSLDPTFSIYEAVGSSSVNAIRCITLQNDKILIGGKFSTYGGVAINQMARLFIDGTVDESFVIGTGADTSVYDMYVVDNKILISGYFYFFNGVSAKLIIRLTSDDLSVPDNSLENRLLFNNDGYYYTFHSKNKQMSSISLFNIDGKSLQKFSEINNFDYSFQNNFPHGVKIIKIKMIDGSEKIVKTVD